uniref:GG20102 n=1 Tax=Drosophila erecta TaxID=7220 RepID=B3P0Z7_DROER
MNFAIARFLARKRTQHGRAKEPANPVSHLANVLDKPSQPVSQANANGISNSNSNSKIINNNSSSSNHFSTSNPPTRQPP